MTFANVFATGVLASLAFAVTAQTPPAAPPAPAASAAAAAGHHGRHAHADPVQRQERFARRMAGLKALLKLTPAQEAAWTSFSNALRPQAAPLRTDRQALARLSTPDRIDQMRALRNERMAQMDRRGEATKAFYATLDAQQKMAFDEATARGGMKAGAGGRGGHRAHGG